jgi:hypothetical protein
MSQFYVNLYASRLVEWLVNEELEQIRKEAIET